MTAEDIFDLLETAEKELAVAVCAAAQAELPTTELARQLDNLRDERRMMREKFDELSEEEFILHAQACAFHLGDAFDEAGRFSWNPPGLAGAISAVGWLAAEIIKEVSK